MQKPLWKKLITSKVARSSICVVGEKELISGRYIGVQKLETKIEDQVPMAEESERSQSGVHKIATLHSGYVNTQAVIIQLSALVGLGPTV
jgi:hypothetical protein